MKLLSCYLLPTFLASYWGAREEKEVSSSDTSKHKKISSILFISYQDSTLANTNSAVQIN